MKSTHKPLLHLRAILMKYWRPLGLLLSAVFAIAVIAQLHSVLTPQSPPNRQGSIAGLTQQYEERCLLPDQASRPIWECYEIPIDTPPHQTVTLQHESGERYQVLSFQDGNQTKFRFTPTQKGRWDFHTRNPNINGSLTINTERPSYAKGFVVAQGQNWSRSATGEIFVPQFIMYDKPDLDAGLDEFIDGHGFSGFHIINLRDLLKNPSYFEAVILKTYRRGGVTHFWVWGDESRRLTPSTYGINTKQLYTEIAARLGPIPGWTVGYGFDLFEWANAREIEQFRTHLRKNCSYYHLVGGRGHKNEYREISSKLDYASWEWHHPSYQDYRDHLAHANQRPAFSEDRFRIWDSNHSRDYDLDQTRRGLWHSTLAGGVANIWGHRPDGQDFSAPYPNEMALKTYSQFVSSKFTAPMEPDNTLIKTGYCLKSENKSAICYAEQPDAVELNIAAFSMPIKIVAIDTQKAYQEIDLPSSTPKFRWQPPYTSDWIFHITSQSTTN